METHYPVSIPAHGTALNITVQSDQDQLDFSLTALVSGVSPFPLRRGIGFE